MSTSQERVYFRGTSEGYPGGRAAQLLRITPVSTDPVVATIFGTESENYAKGIVLIATSDDLAGVKVRKGNVLSALEAEVGLEILPLELAARASIILTAQEARAILREMGIVVPSRITGYDFLSDALRNTPRLKPEQITEFMQRVLELRK